LRKWEGRVLSIVVTVKQVLDPEAPPSMFRLDPESKRAVPAAGVPSVLNPYDVNAWKLPSGSKTYISVG